MRLTFFDGTGVAMDSSVVTVTTCMLQIASCDLNTKGVTNLGLAIWLAAGGFARDAVQLVDIL